MSSERNPLQLNHLNLKLLSYKASISRIFYNLFFFSKSIPIMFNLNIRQIIYNIFS